MEITKNADIKEMAGSVPMHCIATSNSSDKQFLGWVPCTMFFKQGEMLVENLNSFGPKDNRPYAWAPSSLLTWPDGSVKRAQVKSPFFLQPNETTYVEFENGKTPMQSFQWEQGLLDKINQNIIQSGVTVSLKVGGTPMICSPFYGQWKLMRSDNISLVLRFRSKFQSGMPPVPFPLSLTAYVELESLAPYFKVTFVVGNDTLENPVNGGISVTDFQVNSPVYSKAFVEQSYGSKNFHLADGQTMAIRYTFCASNDAVWIDTTDALSQCLVTGFDYYPTVKESGAVSLAPLSSTRVQTENILAAKTQADASISFPFAEAKAHLGHIDKNPPSTGAQPDFASTMPVDLQKAAMAYSTKALSRVYLSCLRESWRPSFYWETRNGVEERCSIVNYPDLFFWSGRVHYHPSWNPQYPQWLTRTGSFNAGQFEGWGSSDNQHLSNNHLRYLYQMTLDPYLEDVLKYYISLDGWNFFTDWINNVEAERATRTTKDAMELVALFPDLPEAILLNQRIQQKMQITNNAVQANKVRFGIAGMAPFNACDPRVNNALWCPASGPNDIVSVGWQTGFHMELQAMSTNIQDYLDDAHVYFLPNGTPKTYFLFPDQNAYVTGGIGISWWSGWIIMALKNPTHPNAAFLLNVVKPVIESDFATSGYWHYNDGWKAW